MSKWVNNFFFIPTTRQPLKITQCKAMLDVPKIVQVNQLRCPNLYKDFPDETFSMLTMMAKMNSNILLFQI